MSQGKFTCYSTLIKRLICPTLAQNRVFIKSPDRAPPDSSSSELQLGASYRHKCFLRFFQSNFSWDLGVSKAEDDNKYSELCVL